MQRQRRSIVVTGFLACTAFHGWVSPLATAQVANTVQIPAQELTFDEVPTTSRRTSLDPFRTQQVAVGSVNTQLTSIPQPPASSPPAVEQDLNGQRVVDEYQEYETPESRRDALTPLQSVALNAVIHPVNISVESIGTGIVPDGADRGPAIESVALPNGYDRAFDYKFVPWQPSLICHYPLYFEDAMLERHGHVRLGCLQSAVSGVKFFGTLPLLPYLCSLKPKHQCEYALGNYRAGSCVPRVRDSLPWDRQAAVVEALAMTSFFWAAPL